MDRPTALRCLLLFAFAFALRAVYLLELSGSVLLEVLIGDGAEYDRWARALVARDGSAPAVFYQAPLYPYLLAMLYEWMGASHVLAMWVQAVAGSAACVCIALTGRVLFDARTGWLAGVLLAVYPFAIFYTGLLQKTTFALLSFCAMLWCLALARDRSGPGLPLLAGISLGALILLRENAMALLPVVALWVGALPQTSPAGWRALRVGALCAGTLLMLAPVAWRNAEQGGGGLLPTTFQLGTNLYAGNFRGSSGRYVPPREGAGFPGREQDDAWQMAEAALGRELTPAEVSGFWTRQAFREIGEDPLSWVGLMLRKSLLLLNAEEVLDIEAPQTYADESALLRFTSRVFHFGVLLPLALWGVVASIGLRRRIWLLYLLFAAMAASVVVFFVLGRLRFPLVPIAVLFAAAGLTALPSLRAARLQRQLACVACLVLGAVLANWPVGGGVTSPRALTWNDVGVALRQQGRNAEALAMFERSIGLDATFYRAYLNKGDLLRASGRTDAALAMIREAIALQPDSAVAHQYLAVALMDAGRLDEAVAATRRSLELDPGNVATRSQLGLLRMRQGRVADAIPHLRAYVERRPDDPRGHNNLGAAFVRAGRTREARAAFVEALRLDPGYVAARRNLERLDSDR